MLSKDKRLNLKTDFKWVRSGKSRETPYFRLMYKDGTNTFPRIGIATSGKVFGNATDRNRSRRLLATAFQSVYDLLKVNLNIVALPKREILEVKSEDLTVKLTKELEILGLLK